MQQVTIMIERDRSHAGALYLQLAPGLKCLNQCFSLEDAARKDLFMNDPAKHDYGLCARQLPFCHLHARALGYRCTLHGMFLSAFAPICDGCRGCCSCRYTDRWILHMY